MCSKRRSSRSSKTPFIQVHWCIQTSTAFMLACELGAMTIRGFLATFGDVGRDLGYSVQDRQGISTGNRGRLLHVHVSTAPVDHRYSAPHPLPQCILRLLTLESMPTVSVRTVRLCSLGFSVGW